MALGAADLGAESLGTDLWVLTGAGGNVIAMRGPDGALLVDGGGRDRSAALLRLALKTTGTKRVHTLFNTHWHPEQTGSNERIGKRGARIIAHENTKQWLGRRIESNSLAAPYGPLPPRALPTHTDGDIYVHFRKANVIAAGGAAASPGRGWPVIDWQTGGWIGGFVGALDKLIQVADDRTRIVPGIGNPLSRAELHAHREMFFTLYDRLTKSLVKGLGPDEVVAAAPAREFEAQWGDSKVFVTAAFKSLWGHFAPDA
jgi:glyoxylase-like metal-dependent hydrolase (beta-lactamase superfamily II)